MHPNIIFITLDCVRRDYLSCYGGKAKTPNIDFLAKKGAIVDTAYTHCPMTGSAHLSIFTSTLPLTHRLRLNGCKVETELPLMTEILKDNGYATAAFIGAFVLNKRFGFNRGFVVYDDAMVQGAFEELILKIFGYSKKWADTQVRKFSRNANRVTNSAIKWLRERNIQTPFFIWAHYFDAHDQFRMPLPLHLYYFRRRDYKKNIEYIDYHIGRLIQYLKKKGILDNTLFVIAADHGEVLYEYEFIGRPYRGHAALAYNVTLKVPLIFSGHTVLQNLHVHQVFRHIDLLPTILSLAAISSKSYKHFEGKNLSRYLHNLYEKKEESEVYAEAIMPTVKGMPEWRVLIRGKWKYVFMPQSKEEFLYNLESDPSEKTNIVHRYPDVASAMKATLLKMMEKDRGSAQGSHDGEVKEALKALGYL